MEVFRFVVTKSQDSSTSEYQSALDCARVCIESTLDDEQLCVELEDCSIVIRSVGNENSQQFEVNELKDKLKGCFCDSHGNRYSEFSKITPE